MSVQVVNKNKAKSSNLGVIALFTEDKFQIKNTSRFLSKDEASYIEKILKNKNNTKENIISLNINEKTTVILISLKKDLKGSDVENLGAKFYNFIKKNSFKDVSIITESLKSKPGKDFIGRFTHGIKLKSYDYNLVDKSAEKIVKTVKSTGAVVSGPIPLPTHKKHFTVLKSPHVNKTAREQFELSSFKRLLDIYSSSSKTVDALMKLELPNGVEVNIKV